MSWPYHAWRASGSKKAPGAEHPAILEGERLEIYSLQKDINTGDLPGMLLHCAGNRYAGR